MIRSYARWFGVDWICAIKELRLLGVPLSEARVQQLETTLKSRRRKRLPLTEVVFDPDPATPGDAEEVPF